MTRVADRLYADVAHNGGHTFYGAEEESVFSSATAPVLTRNAANDVSFNRTAGAAETIQFVKGIDLPRRIIESYQAEQAFQEQFNMAPPAPGRPPYSGVTQLVTPTQAGPSKGIQVDNIYVVYRVGVVGLTSITMRFVKNVYGENVAFSPSAIATTGTPPLGTQANNHTATFTVTTPTMVVDDLSQLQIEVEFVMANTGTLRFYGVGIHYHFNYN